MEDAKLKLLAAHHCDEAAKLFQPEQWGDRPLSVLSYCKDAEALVHFLVQNGRPMNAEVHPGDPETFRAMVERCGHEMVVDTVAVARAESLNIADARELH